MNRCRWVNLNNPKYIAYHDTQWGVPKWEDRILFEMLILESAQAGLSWETILNKERAYKKAYDNFNIEKISRYGKKKKEALLTDSGIIRNKRKIAGSIKNAKVALEIIDEFGSLGSYFWEYVDFTPIENSWKRIEDMPAKTDLSERISKDLKLRGMKFVGPTILYSFMQSIGMVNDHEVTCFRYKEIKHENLKINSRKTLSK